MATIHALSLPPQRAMDDPLGRLWQESGGALQSILPTSTSRNGHGQGHDRSEKKAHWHSLPCPYLPTHIVSFLDRISCPKNTAKLVDIMKVVQLSLDGPLKNTLGYFKDPVFF